MPDWSLISFILASETRFKIIVSLNKKVKSPTELKKEFDVPISRISSVLSELIEYGLIVNLTPNRRKNKIFSLTEKGKKALKDIHEITGP